MKKEFKNKRIVLMSGVACMALMCSGHSARAFSYQFDNGVDVRFDNTIQYSVTERTSPATTYYTDNANTNDGDNNVRSGIASNRVDLLSTFAISDQGFGFDTSVDSFYDTVYNQKTQNTNGATYNAASQPASKYTTQAQTAAGRDIELRNLFVFGSTTIAGMPVTLRVGRLTNLFGESLFFAGNGIAYAQGPIDAARAAAVPNTQAKDLFLPVGQALLSVNLTNSISVDAYYQFQWQQYNLAASGSFFSFSDITGEGAQRFYVATISPYINAEHPGVAAYAYRAYDLTGSDTGQFGAAVHYDPIGSNWDFGFYALQYNDSSPQLYLNEAATPKVVPGTASSSPTALAIGTYQLVYANGIQIYGASASTTIGPVNLAGEASVRANEDLVSLVVNPAGTPLPGNNEHDAAYAIGDVAHYQVSELYAGPKIPGLWDASSVAGEAAGENLFAIVKNKQNFDTAASQHMALGFRAVGSATYFAVLPGLDLTPNIGLGWNFMGKSPDTLAFNDTGIDRGGDLTLGVSGTYLNVWTGGISYSRVVAPETRSVNADRDFVSFNVERTF